MCYKEPLFNKVVSGEKIQTRRLVNIPEGYKYERSGPCGPPQGPSLLVINDQYNRKFIYPRYRPGEIVYLKEPYAPNIHVIETLRGVKNVEYLYGSSVNSKNTYHWKNKLFMPEMYARYFTKIKEVSVERAHDITEADAVLEGCRDRAEFENWWIKIHGFSSWSENPWVWKYDFVLTNK